MIKFFKPTKQGLPKNEQLESSPRSISYTNWLNKYKKSIIVFYIFISFLSIGAILKVQMNSNPFDYFPDDFHLTVATDLVEEKIGGALSLEMIIDTENEGIKPVFLNKVDTFQKCLNQKKKYQHNSVVDIIKDESSIK